MRRIRLRVAYDGTNYSGWQIQPSAITIEKVLDDAIHQLTGEHIHVIGASRTDAGVHAMGNVAVFDTASSIPADRFTYALNRYLPDDVIVQESDEVNADFHPRHCDTKKTYWNTTEKKLYMECNGQYRYRPNEESCRISYRRA